MYADMYAEVDRICNEEDAAFETMGCYLIEVPWTRRTGFYLHTFTHPNGRFYRTAFLPLKFLRVLAWRCRMVRYRRLVSRILGI
jgi:hypothetical protein